MWNNLYTVTDNYITFLDKISRFVTHEIILYLCQKTFESQQRQV